MKTFNIAEIKLNIDILDKKIAEYIFLYGFHPCVIMSSDTLELFKKEKYSEFKTFTFNKEEKVNNKLYTMYKYDFCIILINDFLEEGVIELR